ncbi:hypothetical protein T265_02616 [Opisthorchis viverrini]|uniref:Mitochondrial DNA polymerase catalytic subunit n=1 Tax=Opisthorchis viverrini TaxID=6198 RepID=A0A074ZUA1_OPIVI|nr:hypothetical protein T265_02616 [Opisthorchis viverrini]KER31053.1 hypothetical protein T265_02616 [Opisthorchis viverrini]
MISVLLRFPCQPVLSRCIRLTSLYAQGCAVTKIVSNAEQPTYNEVRIQMLSRHLQACLFGCEISRYDLAPQSVLNELEKHGIDVNRSQPERLPVSFSPPDLIGGDIEKHMQNISAQLVTPYRKLLDSFSGTVPPMPESWSTQSGWTRYSGDQIESVRAPVDDIMVLDIEVLMEEGDLPTMAVVLTPNGWYSWVSPNLYSEKLSTNETLDSLIPLYDSKDTSRPKCVIGHFVSFDRARLLEEYYLQGTGTRFLDTLSFHVAVSGLTSTQRHLKTAASKHLFNNKLWQKYMSTHGETSKLNDVEEHANVMNSSRFAFPPKGLQWISETSLNNLTDVYRLYCAKEPPQDKTARSVFECGTRQEVQTRFQELMRYCATDVSMTYEVFQKLLPLFKERFPHPATLYGMLEMGSMYLPINDSWSKFQENADRKFAENEQRQKQLLMQLADQALQHYSSPDADPQNDPWLWDLDWALPKIAKANTEVDERLSKLPNGINIKSRVVYIWQPTAVTEILRKPAHGVTGASRCELINRASCVCFQERSTEQIEHGDAAVTDYAGNDDEYHSESNHIFAHCLHNISCCPLRWYRELIPKPIKENLDAGPALLTAQMRIAPKLLRLCWQGLPLHYDQIRQTIVPAVTRNRNMQLISKQERDALTSLRKDETIVILPADKGRIMVIMDKPDYIEKAKQLLNDTTTYKPIDHDPTSNVINRINTTLKKLQETHEITRQERWKMKADDTNIARFYGLPKVHKEGTPLRPIVSLPGTPTYKLAKDLWRRLKHLISGSEHTVNNAGQFLHKLRNVSIEDDEVMLSFDVTSLFTSINHNLARTTIAELLQTKPNTTGTMKPESIGKLLDFCMDTYFTFDGQIYQQLKGTPMGSPISGFIAEAVMQRLEHAVLPIINPKLWIRYVDDTFVIMKRDSVHEAHELLNTTFEDIKFTIELERNNRLPFLDVLVNRKMDGTLETCVYRKETHTDQILNYNSNHPVNHKKSCVQTLFKRAETHCSTTELRKKEENHLLRVFQNNGYPRNFIKRSLKKKTPQPRQQQEQATRRVVLPYIRNISELATRLLAQKGIFVAHKPNATLRKLISRPKDNPDKTKKNSVIYQLNCDNCIKFYVGQTGRRLCTRIKEHNAAVRRHDPLSLISIHEDQEGHKFNLENAEILELKWGVLIPGRAPQPYGDPRFYEETSVNCNVQANSPSVSDGENTKQNQDRTIVSESVNNFCNMTLRSRIPVSKETAAGRVEYSFPYGAYLSYWSAAMQRRFLSDLSDNPNGDFASAYRQRAVPDSRDDHLMDELQRSIQAMPLEPEERARLFATISAIRNLGTRSDDYGPNRQGSSEPVYEYIGEMQDPFQRKTPHSLSLHFYPLPHWLAYFMQIRGPAFWLDPKRYECVKQAVPNKNPKSNRRQKNRRAVDTVNPVIPTCWFNHLPHDDGEGLPVGSPLSRSFQTHIAANRLHSASMEMLNLARANAQETPNSPSEIQTAHLATELLRDRVHATFWQSYSKRIRNQMAVWLPTSILPTEARNDPNFNPSGHHGAILPQVIVAGTVSRRAVEPLWLTASNADRNRLGSEIKAMVQAPPGYCFVGADVDSQEMWIAALIGDASFGFQGKSFHSPLQLTSVANPKNSATPYGWMTLEGNKTDGTDLHTKIAQIMGITRNEAKVLNYARLYGSGHEFTKHLLTKFSNLTLIDSGICLSLNRTVHISVSAYTSLVLLFSSISRFCKCVFTNGLAVLEKLTVVMQWIIKLFSSIHVVVFFIAPQPEQAGLKANQLLRTTKGQRTGSHSRAWKKPGQDSTEQANNASEPSARWQGGSESAVFNELESIARSSEPCTPVLKARMTRALNPKLVKEDFLPSRINWVVQSSAVDYLHCMLLVMGWLIQKYSLPARLCISIHDEVRYLCRQDAADRVALALQISNLFTRAFFAYQLGMRDLPESVAFFSSVEIDTCLRKNPDDDCITPSNPDGLQKTYGIPSASPRDELNPALKEGVNPNQRLKTTVLPIILSGNMVKGKSRTVIVTLNRRPVHISLSMMGDTLDRRRVLTSGCSQMSMLTEQGNTVRLTSDPHQIQWNQAADYGGCQEHATAKICVLQIVKALNSNKLNTILLKTVQCSSHYFINDEVEQQWREWTSLSDTNFCREAFGEFTITLVRPECMFGVHARVPEGAAGGDQPSPPITDGDVVYLDLALVSWWAPRCQTISAVPEIRITMERPVISTHLKVAAEFGRTKAAECSAGRAKQSVLELGPAEKVFRFGQGRVEDGKCERVRREASACFRLPALLYAVSKATRLMAPRGGRCGRRVLLSLKATKDDQFLIQTLEQLSSNYHFTHLLVGDFNAPKASWMELRRVESSGRFAAALIEVFQRSA